ncbi:leukocyte elastase inhibitor-like [Discoglossus pictus]
MDSVIASNNTFAVELYKKITEYNADQNIFFSPWSISSALAMVYLGAKGNTGLQMAQVLHFGKSGGAKGCKTKTTCGGKSDNVHSVFQELLSIVNQPSSRYLLKTANKLYNEKSFNVLKEYLQQVQTFYHAEIQAVDFVREAEEARKTINSWVETHTEGKIKDLLSQGSVDSQTILVLVNAVYFKGNWNNKFLEENTEEKPFRMSKTKSKPVRMMFQRNKFNTHYIEDLETWVLELPYIQNELSMIILLPDDIKDDTTGLEQLEKEINYKKLQEWTREDAMEITDVALDFPKIQLEESYDLKSTLTSMGLQDLFSPVKADLRGMADTNKLFLSQVFHKSFLEINEAGTEAASATAAVIAVKSSPISVRFEADHPFIFFIRHNKTKSILFYGKFCLP